MSIAINKTIVKASAVAGLWTLTLSDVDGILIGAKGDVDGFLTQSYNHQNITITAVDTTLKTIQYQTGNATVAEFAPDANFHLTITWIDVPYVEDMLGFSPTGSDLDYLTECVNSAQDWAYRKRAEAGYDPHPAFAGGADIRQGTGLMAMMLYRERGTSGDQYASYNSMGQFDRPISLARVMQLLGCGRAQVA